MLTLDIRQPVSRLIACFSQHRLYYAAMQHKHYYVTVIKLCGLCCAPDRHNEDLDVRDNLLSQVLAPWGTSHESVQDSWKISRQSTFRHRSAIRTMRSMGKAHHERCRDRGMVRQLFDRMAAKWRWRMPIQLIALNKLERQQRVEFGPQALALLPQLIVQAIERTTPPSTRSAAPVVAEACSEHAYTTMFATSSVVANRLISVVGRAVLRNCCSACS